MKKYQVSALLLMIVLTAGLAISPALAVKTKKPPVKKTIEGGRNQLEGLEGKMGEMLFNGGSRFKLVSIAYPEKGPNGETPDEGKKWLVASVLIKNAHEEGMWYGEGHLITFLDQDDQSVQTSNLVKANNWDDRPSGILLPAAGIKGDFVVAVDKDFVPVRCVVQINSSEKVFRVKIPTPEATS